MIDKLYDLVGGRHTISAATERFYKKVLEDDSLRHFFGETDMAHHVNVVYEILEPRLLVIDGFVHSHFPEEALVAPRRRADHSTPFHLVSCTAKLPTPHDATWSKTFCPALSPAVSNSEGILRARPSTRERMSTRRKSPF